MFLDPMCALCLWTITAQERWEAELQQICDDSFCWASWPFIKHSRKNQNLHRHLLLNSSRNTGEFFIFVSCKRYQKLQRYSSYLLMYISSCLVSYSMHQRIKSSQLKTNMIPEQFCFDRWSASNTICSCIQ